MRYFDAEFIATLIFLLLITLVLSGVYFLNKKSCYETAKALNYKCEFNIWTGCVLEKKDGKKVLLEQLRDFEE